MENSSRSGSTPSTVSNSPATKWTPVLWLSCLLLAHQSVRYNTLKLARISLRWILHPLLNAVVQMSYILLNVIFSIYSICKCINICCDVLLAILFNFADNCVFNKTRPLSYSCVGLVLSDWLTGHSATKHAHLVGVSNRQNSYLIKFDSLLYFPHILPFNVAFINKHPTKLLIMQVWKNCQ